MMTSLKLRFRALAVFALFAGAAAAQSAVGYLSVGVGSNAGGTIVEPSGGAEVVLGQTVGVGGQLGAVLRQHGSFGFVSADGSYHLARNAKSGKFDPFIEGGYTRAFQLFSGANGGNFGFGLNYWFSRRLGIRGQFRELLLSGTSNNYWAVSAGIAFR
jgi:hypothetical protein